MPPARSISTTRSCRSRLIRSHPDLFAVWTERSGLLTRSSNWPAGLEISPARSAKPLELSLEPHPLSRAARFPGAGPRSRGGKSLSTADSDHRVCRAPAAGAESGSESGSLHRAGQSRASRGDGALGSVGNPPRTAAARASGGAGHARVGQQLGVPRPGRRPASGGVTPAHPIHGAHAGAARALFCRAARICGECRARTEDPGGGAEIHPAVVAATSARGRGISPRSRALARRPGAAGGAFAVDAAAGPGRTIGTRRTRT